MDQDPNPLKISVESSGSAYPQEPAWRQWRDGILKAVLFGFLLIFLSLHFADPIRLVTADLGRHLKNGELILAGQAKVLTSNFYSYTYPDYPFINHHWATGVLFYLVYKGLGFNGLSYVYVGLLLCGFYVYFRLAERLSSFSFAFFFSVLALPLISDRLEIRPEGITTLLTGLYLYFLFMHRSGKLSFKRLLWALPLFQIVWVNTHILFFIGGFLVFAFLIDAWLGRQDKIHTRQLLIVTALTAAVCLINPAGVKGALVPLTIFKEYGYRLAENQTVFFMQKRFGHDPKYLYFEILSVLSFIGLFFYSLRHKVRQNISVICVWLFFLVLGMKTVRSMASFAFVFIPLASLFAYESLGGFSRPVRKVIGGVLLTIALITVGNGLVSSRSFFSPARHLESFIQLNGGRPEDVNVAYLLKHPQVMTGLVPGINDSADFVKRAGIQGPMFNNYDIGGYLIFHLYPQIKVFVDNRPEVYSVSFFKDDYIPMQENNDAWQRMDEKYGFNVIYFYRHDLTPWGQNFLVNRIRDPQWAPVYVDLFTIIFLKRNAQNKPVIDAYELPQSMFAVTQ
jgi:hypothetical protein